MMRSNDGSRRAATPEPHASACAIFQRRASRDAGRLGFTLVEMVVAVSIMSVLMFGVASAILIASHAMPKANEENQLIRDGAWAVDEMSEEVRTALWFIEHTATAMTFTVPDREGNGLPERIRYEWSGSPGDPLTRQYNGGTAVHVIEELYDFALSYELKSVDEQYPGPEVESAEVLHNSYTSANDLHTFEIREGEWIGEYFKPTLPVEATSWSVTRVRLIARENGAASGETRIQLRTADGSNFPTGTVIEEKSMWESSLLDSYAVQEFSYSTVSGLSPSDGLCLVLEWMSGGRSADILYDEAGSDRLTTNDAGSSWDIDGGKSMRFMVYGEYTSPGPQQTATRQYVTSVGIRLAPSDNPASRIVTAAPTYNMPEVLSGMWLAEFDADPTLDHNGDGVGDWTTGGQSFKLGNLSGGVYSADGSLYNQPASDLDVLTTVEVRFRDESDNGKSGGVQLRVDRVGDVYAYIEADVTLTATQQQLAITTWDDAAWVTQGFNAGVFIDVRFVVDPGADTVNIQVNGVDAGTFSYSRRTITGQPQAVEMYETANSSGVQFDHVRVRVGGTGS